VFRGLPDDPFHTARDRIRAAIVNSGERWPDAEITVSLTSAGKPEGTGSLDLVIGVAILAAADDLPHAQIQSALFLAELGLNGRLRSPVGTAELLATVTREVLPAISEDNACTLVVPMQDAPAAMEAISRRKVPSVQVVGARHFTDVAAWLRDETQLGLSVDRAE
jgi:magnesium chelatase family protein